MSLSRIEKETIIVYNEEEATAEVFTYQKSLIRQLDKMISENHPVEFVKENSEGGRTCRVPKKLVKIRKPLALASEDVAKRTEHLKNAKNTF